MDVFISWSQERSKFVANCLRDWLPKVIQAIDPWMSDVDIYSGSRWSSEIAIHLEKASFGIFCITPENQSNPWINYEAGALSKMIEKSNVCPLLIEMEMRELVGPLTQFQANRLNRDGLWNLVKDLNQYMYEKGTSSLGENQLEESFNIWWPTLNEKISQIPQFDSDSKPQKSQKDILQELLGITRTIAHQIDQIGGDVKTDKAERFDHEILKELNSDMQIAIKEILERLSDDRLFFAALVIDEKIIHIDRIGSPYNRRFLFGSSAEDKTDKMFALLKNSDSIFESLTNNLEPIEQGNLIRVTLDVEMGAVFLFRITSKTLLMGATASQNAIDESEEMMFEIARAIQVYFGLGGLG